MDLNDAANIIRKTWLATRKNFHDTSQELSLGHSLMKWLLGFIAKSHKTSGQKAQARIADDMAAFKKRFTSFSRARAGIAISRDRAFWIVSEGSYSLVGVFTDEKMNAQERFILKSRTVTFIEHLEHSLWAYLKVPTEKWEVRQMSFVESVPRKEYGGK